MADIFISYARVDLDRVRPIAAALQVHGWDVWWDIEDLRGGESFNRAIRKALNQAKCVVVLWSKTSVESEYVEAEAYWAKQNKKLVSVVIDQGLELPVPFNTIHSDNLSGWSGNITAPDYNKLIADLTVLAEIPTAENAKRRAAGQAEREQRKAGEEAKRNAGEDGATRTIEIRKAEEASKFAKRDAQPKAIEGAQQLEEPERKEQVQFEEKKLREEDKAKREATTKKERQQSEAKARLDVENAQRERAEKEQNRQNELQAKRQAEERLKEHEARESAVTEARERAQAETAGFVEQRPGSAGPQRAVPWKSIIATIAVIFLVVGAIIWNAQEPSVGVERELTLEQKVRASERRAEREKTREALSTLDPEALTKFQKAYEKQGGVFRKPCSSDRDCGGLKCVRVNEVGVWGRCGG